jgi:hypothetical protein
LVAIDGLPSQLPAALSGGPVVWSPLPSGDTVRDEVAADLRDRERRAGVRRGLDFGEGGGCWGRLGRR